MVRSPVVTVTVAVVGVVPLGVTGLEEIEQLAADGRPVQLRATGCANPLIDEIVRVYCADLPAETVALGGRTESAKSGFCTNPVPVSRTI